MQLAALVQYIYTSESSYFSTKPGDFLFFCLFGMVFLWIYSFFLPVVFLGTGLMSYFLYYTTKRAPDNRMMLFVLPLPVRAPYIPLIILALFLLAREHRSLLSTLGGYSGAHLYFFVKDLIGLRFDTHFLTAPTRFNQFLNGLLHP
jgi:hypothetical protein